MGSLIETDYLGFLEEDDKWWELKFEASWISEANKESSKSSVQYLQSAAKD